MVGLQKANPKTGTHIVNDEHELYDAWEEFYSDGWCDDCRRGPCRCKVTLGDVAFSIVAFPILGVVGPPIMLAGWIIDTYKEWKSK